MAFQTLLRRSTQLALLASACRQRTPARICPRRRPGRASAVRLLELGPRSLLVAWAARPLTELEQPGQSVEVRFKHQGQRYAFVARSQGRAGRRDAGSTGDRMLELGLPLRVERGERRRHPRLALQTLPPIVATFTHVVDERREFRGRLIELGAGGLRAAVRAAEVGPIHTGDLFWVSLELPDRTTPPERIVRLIHLRPIARADQLALGCRFEAADDPESRDRWLCALEVLARQAGRDQRRGA